MSQEWHYAHGGVQKGPVTEAQLKARITLGQLLPNDLVWRDGMAEWVKAGTVRELFPAKSALPPPPPPPARKQPQPHPSTLADQAGTPTDNSVPESLVTEATPNSRSMPPPSGSEAELAPTEKRHGRWAAVLRWFQKVASNVTPSARFSVVRAAILLLAFFVVVLAVGLMCIGAASAYRWWRPHSICEVSELHDTGNKWQELRIVLQGNQELVNFRSISKENSGGWVWAIYLSGENELEVFRAVMDEYLKTANSEHHKLQMTPRRKLGQTSQHEFWLSFLHASEPVLEYSDPKNMKRGRMSMLSTETVQTFQKLSKQYSLLHSTLRRMTSRDFQDIGQHGQR